MQLEELIQTVSSYTGSPEAESILRIAFQLASDAHSGFQRVNGEPFLSHALAVTTILAEWHAPLSVVVTGLLHDFINPDYSRERSLDKVQAKIGLDICQRLEAINTLNSLIRRIEGDLDSEANRSNTHYYIISILQQEPDVIVIKIADRLHNLQSISALTRYFQERAARLGFNLLAPLADQLGMGAVKRQVENLCFEIINPVYYKMFEQQFADTNIHQDVKGVLAGLQEVLRTHMSKSEIRWQPTSLYNLYRQQVELNAKLGRSIHTVPLPLRMDDIGSFIILTEEESDCYRALGIIHKLYPPVKGQFHDFIGNHRENGYRSLHTQVKHSSGNLLNAIIRTRTMDLIAEYGITARWRNVPEELLPQLPRSITSVDGEIQVFTPNGDLKHLPSGATVIDFAYAIHSDVGNRCKDALVNGEHVDLYRILQTGDTIEIILGGPNDGPSVDWLDIVRTPQAASRIRQWLTRYQRDTMLERGRILLDRELQPLGLDSADIQVRQLLSKLAMKDNLEKVEDLFISIGVGRHKVPKLVERLKSMRLKTLRSSNYIEPNYSVNVLSPQYALLPHIFARCCNPVPSDDIVGLLRTDNILVIHKRTCINIKELERIIPLKWGTIALEPNYVVIVEALNRPNLASDISSIITILGLDMQGFSAYKQGGGSMAEALIYLGRTTSAQRTRLQKALEEVPYVTGVEVIHSSFLTISPSLAEASKPIPRSNPYGPAIAAGSRFYGREMESQRISALLGDQSQNITILLWGQRRIGKTSFVLRLQEKAQGSFFPVYIDMQGLKDGSTTQFLYHLMNRISIVLKEISPDSLHDVSVPSLNRLGKNPLSYFDTFMGLVQEITRQNPLVLVLDEFQCLCTLQEAVVSRSAIFSRLRSHSQHGQGIHIILSGGGLLSQLLEQCEIISLFNIAYDEKLGCLERGAAHHLIIDGLAQVGDISEQAVELLLALTAGHPYYLQLLCSMLYEKAQENRTLLTEHVTTQITQEWLSKADSSRFQHLWEGRDTKSAQRNKLILSAIAQLGVKNNEIEYDRLASVIGSTVPERDLVQSLQDLTELGVLRNNSSNYAITVELFAHWLRQHWPLALTLKEALWT